MNKQLFIEYFGQDDNLYIWCVEYENEITFISTGLLFHQLMKIPCFNSNDVQFISIVNHPIHGDITQVIINEAMINRFYADLPSKRRGIVFQGRKVKFLLIDVFQQQEDNYQKLRYSNALIFLLEHYKSARVKQEFESLKWNTNGADDEY